MFLISRKAGSIKIVKLQHKHLRESKFPSLKGAKGVSGLRMGDEFSQAVLSKILKEFKSYEKSS